MVAEFKRRRDMLVPALNAIHGVKCLMPQGAFYVFADISSFGMSSEDLTWYLLREAGCAVVPGPTFGPAGEGYVRISFANSFDKIKQATERIALALGRLAK
jgi:aspartate/methionine/tyrosine aminotransferase